MSFPQCVSSYVDSEKNYLGKFDKICNTYKVFPRCVFSYASHWGRRALVASTTHACSFLIFFFLFPLFIKDSDLFHGTKNKLSVETS